MKYLLGILAAAFLSVGTSSALKVVNETNGDQLSHQFECTDKNELFKGPLGGFISLRLTDGQVIHFPLAEITQVTEMRYGVYLEFRNERMKNGNGFMTTTIYMPKDVMEPNDTLALFRSCQ